jgi:hypothetical protein
VANGAVVKKKKKQKKKPGLAQIHKKRNSLAAENPFTSLNLDVSLILFTAAFFPSIVLFLLTVYMFCLCPSAAFSKYRHRRTATSATAV